MLRSQKTVLFVETETSIGRRKEVFMHWINETLFIGFSHRNNLPYEIFFTNTSLEKLKTHVQISIHFTFLLEFSALLVPLIYRSENRNGERRSWRRSKNLEASSDTRASSKATSLQDLLHQKDCTRRTKHYHLDTESLNSLEKPTFL